MFPLRDLPKYEVIRQRAEKYPEIDPDGLEAFLILLRVGSDVFAAFERYFARHQLSHGTFSVLMLLYREPEVGLNPSNLATRCGVTRATMTGLLDGLQRKKLIRRESNQTDRRTILIHLNDGGITLLESLLHDYYRRVSDLMGIIPPPDKKRLSEMLFQLTSGIAHINRA
jgi:DNA-binding MarR family transcriptional regulator